MNILDDIIIRQARRYGDRRAVAYIDASGEPLIDLSYNDLDGLVQSAARGLETLGLAPGESVLIFSPNRPEMLITDFACYYNRAMPVSIYSTSSTEQALYVIRDCKPRFIFVGGELQMQIIAPAASQCGCVQKIISYDDQEGAYPWSALLGLGRKASELCRAEVEKRRLSASPADTATLIYTSGTTGEPKGVDLPHSCFNAVVEIHEQRLTMLSDRDTSLCFLPLCHIFEKAWSYYCLHLGIAIYINKDPHEIADTLQHVRPTCMCSVPRLWEKVYAGVLEKIAEMSVPARAMVKMALKVGHKRNLEYVRLGKKAPWWLESLYRQADARIFHRVKNTVGISRGTIFPTAGAPIAPHIVEFFRSIGVPMVVGYGLSETTATVTCFPDEGYVIGSVGTVMPRLQVRIGNGGEIEVKGPTVMRCYYNKPQATREAFTADGWFRTGDAGYFDSEGALVLTERIKDLFKTSNGKYVAPQAIESRLGGDRYIEQVAVIGDSRKYVSAIIVPAFAQLKEYARDNKIEFSSVEELIKHPRIVKLISDRIEASQKGLPSFEQIKKFTLLPKPFTIESGELTNTLKIKRSVIASRYAKEIDAMY